MRPINSLRLRTIIDCCLRFCTEHTATLYKVFLYLTRALSSLFSLSLLSMSSLHRTARMNDAVEVSNAKQQLKHSFHFSPRIKCTSQQCTYCVGRTHAPIFEFHYWYWLRRKFCIHYSLSYILTRNYLNRCSYDERNFSDRNFCSIV